MKNVYGLKMLETSDIIEKCGRPIALCNYLKEEIGHGLKFEELGPNIIIDTSLQGNLPIFNTLNPFKMIFVPMEYAEQKIVHDSMEHSLSTTRGRVVSYKHIESVEKIVNQSELRLMDVEDKYADKEAIVSVTCCMALFIDDEKLVDVYTAVPGDIINFVLLKNPVYTCELCSKEVVTAPTTESGYIPDMRYEVIEGRIIYYCDDCVSRNGLHHLKHVGE